MPVTGAWPGNPPRGPADGPGQQPVPQEATLASAPPVLYGPGWQTPTQPHPPVAPAKAGGPDLMSRLRGAYPQPGMLPTGKKLVLAVAAAAIVVAAIVAGLSLSGRSSSGTSNAASSSASPAAPPSAATLASRQAAAVSNLLGSSAATRRSLEGAVSEVRNCSSLPAATSQIRTVVSQRSTEYRHASALSLANLAGGAAVRSDLLAALRTSLDADQDYLAWARQQQGSGCTPAAQSGAYSTAISADQQAGTAKAAFVQVWNPIATKYRLPQESPGDI
jgi:hypothetical protein